MSPLVAAGSVVGSGLRSSSPGHRASNAVHSLHKLDKVKKNSNGGVLITPVSDYFPAPLLSSSCQLSH